MVHNTSRSPLPWWRLFLFLGYAALTFFLVSYELAARRILQAGWEAQSVQKYGAASIAYQVVIENYPLTMATVQARDGLAAIRPAVAAMEPGGDVERWNRTTLESLWPQLDPHTVHQFAIVGLAGAACVFALLTASRLFRRTKQALLSAVLAAASAGTLVPLMEDYGLLDLGVQAGELRAMAHDLGTTHIEAVHIATWCLAGLAALMSLTSPHPQRVALTRLAAPHARTPQAPAMCLAQNATRHAHLPGTSGP